MATGHVKPFIVKGVDFRDPVQNRSINDCGLIAAMSAVAFVKPMSIEGVIVDRPTYLGRYKFRFQSLNGENYSPEEIEVNGWLREGEGATSSDIGETWPSLLEKAYYKFISRKEYESTDNKNFELVLEYTIPNEALRQISGLRGLEYRTREDEGSWRDVPHEILALCNDLGEAISQTTVVGAVERPIVASTVNNVVHERMKAFSLTGLAMSHAYAVLGMTANGDLLLRDPGNRAKEGAGKVRIVGNDGTWELMLEDRDGVFLLGCEDFLEFFWDVAWVFSDGTSSAC